MAEEFEVCCVRFFFYPLFVHNLSVCVCLCYWLLPLSLPLVLVVFVLLAVFASTFGISGSVSIFFGKHITRSLMVVKKIVHYNNRSPTVRVHWRVWSMVCRSVKID